MWWPMAPTPPETLNAVLPSLHDVDMASSASARRSGVEVQRTTCNGESLFFMTVSFLSKR